MGHVERHRDAMSRISIRATVAAFVVGGLASTLLLANAAGAASSHRPKAVVISTAKSPSLGTILVSRKTVYTLKASKTACTAQCQKIWPEVVLPRGVKKAKAGSGVNAAKLGTIKRSHGVLQVTYSGKPIYRFVGDTAAGQVNGQITDKWGKWSVFVTVKPAAAATTTAPSTSPTTTSPTNTLPTTGGTSTPATSPPTTATVPPTTTPPTSPTTTPTTAPPTTTTAPPPTTTTTSPGSGGIGF